MLMKFIEWFWIVQDPLLAAGGPGTFVATKVPKKAFSRNASLPHMASAPQIRQNHGLQLFCATSFAHFPPLQQKLAMPLQPHRPALFCPLSPEAYLLTEEINNSINH